MTLRQYRWLQASGCTLTDQWWSFLRVSWWRRPWSSRVNVLKQSVNLVPGHASSLVWQLQHNLTCTETVCQSRAWPHLLTCLTTTTQPHVYWNSLSISCLATPPPSSDNYHTLTCTETVCQSCAWPRLLPRLTTTTHSYMYWHSLSISCLATPPPTSHNYNTLSRVLTQSVNLVPGHASSHVSQLQHTLTSTDTVCQSRAWPRLLPRLTTTTHSHEYWNTLMCTETVCQSRAWPRLLTRLTTTTLSRVLKQSVNLVPGHTSSHVW